MTIVVTGGGSGGHITPILAVASELKRLDPKIQIVYIGHTGDKLGDVPAKDPNIDKTYTIRAGKFRRYHGQGIAQFLDISTDIKNVRDLFYTIVGICQSFFLLRKLRPEIIFTRGGYVSVPVALGGKLNGIPFITHDSDSTPSLANRLIARWASMHAVALPEEIYPYPIDKTVTVGIPISDKYVYITPELKARYMSEIGFPQNAQLLLITGGGNGAEGLNDNAVANAKYLLKAHPKLYIVNITGRSLLESVKVKYDEQLDPEMRKRVIVKGFIHDLHLYSGAADVIVMRGTATNFAEFEVQAKACVSIPSSGLIWNIKNTDALVSRQAVMKLDEDQAEQDGRLASVVGELLDHPDQIQNLGKRLASFGKPDAAEHLAKLLIEEAKSK